MSSLPEDDIAAKFHAHSDHAETCQECFEVSFHMLQVFGAKLQLPVTHPAALAGLLLQPCTQQPFQQKGSQACPLVQLHLQLLQLVRVFCTLNVLNTCT